eukprot:1156846-Pelagomonas_calceolata.AAC.3
MEQRNPTGLSETSAITSTGKGGQQTWLQERIAQRSMPCNKAVGLLCRLHTTQELELGDLLHRQPHEHTNDNAFSPTVSSAALMIACRNSRCARSNSLPPLRVSLSASCHTQTQASTATL